MRSLTLHASALNDAEYELYTSSLRDLVDSDDTPNDPLSFDDARYEQIRISTREARAWLRGRYNELPVHQIDSILKTIALNNAQGEGLSVRQFFAVMRLVMHARTGKEPDASLVFVQGEHSFRYSIQLLLVRVCIGAIIGDNCFRMSAGVSAFLL